MSLPSIRLGAALMALLFIATQAQAQNLELSDTGVKLDGIAAIVNDGVVLTSELDDQVNAIVARLRADGTRMPPMNVLREQILESLIVKEIQLQRARRGGIEIPDEMLNRTLADIARRNNTTLAEFPDLLAKDGIDYALYRNELREQMTIERLRQIEVVSRIAINPRELEEYLSREASSSYRSKRYKVSHILISLSTVTDPQILEAVQDQVWKLYEELQAGADFAQAALANSDAQTALEGGSMGWREGDALPTVFAEVVPNMQVGEISEPIRTSSGFHIVKLDDVEGAEVIMEDQTHARHILMKTDEVLDDDIVQQKLTEVRQEIVEGGDFAAIAKAVSEDPGSAVDGGDLGWTGPGIFVPEFEKVMAELDENEISEPFKSPFGWHIIQVLERRTHDTTEDVRKQRAMIAIRDSKVEEETELWVRQIRDEAFVEFMI